MVLGIDAAWTLSHPSGVALVIDCGDGWRIVAAEPSYEHFLSLADRLQTIERRPVGSAPEARLLLRSAAQLAGAAVDLVAVDMPLSRRPIVARRAADNAVSRAYGSRKCSTHTPSAARPGQLSDTLRTGFEVAGYQLRTEHIELPGLIEVYPHPALVELAGAVERLPYKLAKTRNYWREMPPVKRREMLIGQWTSIASMLEAHIAGASAALPSVDTSSSLSDLKAHEDVLDALICAWVATVALDGGAIPYGDEDAAIWIPAPPRTDAPALSLMSAIQPA